MTHKKIVGFLVLLLALTSCASSSDSVEDLTPYKGDGTTYVSVMTKERDRLWEEDIVWLADEFLDPLYGHPYITDRNTKITSYPASTGYYPVNHVENLFDPELREQFISRVNALIVQIPELDDEEILFELNSIVALLDDIHSGIATPWEMIFPNWYKVIFDGEGGYRCYITATASDTEDALLCEVLAVNGVSLPELVEKARPCIPHETEEYLITALLDGSVAYLNNCSFLKYLGVVEKGNTVVFTLKDEAGRTFDMKMQAHSLFRLSILEMTPADCHDQLWLVNSRPDETLWLEYLEDTDTVYVRMSATEYYSVNALPELLSGAAEELGEISKLVLDLRGNPGGSADFQGLAWWLSDLENVGQVYILLDSLSASAAVGLPSLMKQTLNDTVLVGMSPAQRPFTPTTTAGVVSSPNENITMAQSNVCVNFWTDYEYDVLQMDRYVYQTWEDYLNGVDTVLEAVLND